MAWSAGLQILRSTQQQQQHKPFSRSCSSAVPGPTARLTPTEQSDLQQALCDLSQLSEELLPRCSPREMSNIAWGFAALGFYNRRLMQLLLGRCSLAALKPQEMSNLVWAVAKLGHEVPAAWVDEALLVSGRVLAARSFKPQEAANLAWGLATIQRRCLTSGVAGSGSSGLFSSCVRVDSSWKQGLCQTISEQLGFWQAADMSQGLWALAVLGFSVFQQQWLDRVLVRALQLLGGGRLQSRHAASMLWAVAKLHLQQQQLSGWQSGAAAAAAATNGDSNANSSSSSGSSGGSEVSATVAVFATAIASKLPLLLRDEQQPLRFAAVLCHSYQQLQLQPPAAALDVLLAAAARQLNSLDLSAAAAHAAGDSRPTHSSGRQQQQRRRRPELLLDLSMLLHSLAKLSYRPQAAFMDLVAAVVADSAWRVVDCHDQLATLGTAWAALQQQHDDTHQGVMQQQQEQQEEKEKQQQRQAEREDGTGTGALRASKQQRILQQRQLLLGELQSSLRGRHASLLLWAFAKLHYQPSAEVLRPLKMACLRQRGALNAADVGVLLWALARMRHRPGYAWVRFMLQSFLSSIDDRVSGAADVANVVHALPHLPGGANQRYVLRKKVGQGVLQGVADAAAARFSECGPQELVQLVQGWALLGFRPGGVWVQQHQARVGEVGRAAFSEREWETLQAAYQQLPVEGEGEGEEQVSAA